MGRRTVLVTGVSRGIGKAIAARCAADGYEVVGVSRTAPDNFPGRHVALDLGSPAAKAALAELAAEHQPARLVANAGVVLSDRLEDVTAEDFAATYRLNIEATLWAMQACLPAMREERFGRIVLLGSRAALGKVGRAVYGSSKAAVTGLARSMALELAADGVTANVVAPGPIETEMLAVNQPADSPERARLLAATPMKRAGAPAEVAAAVSYFLSDEAGFTTGQTLYVCGGYSVGVMHE